MLKGKKINLRQVEEEDIDLFLKWFNDPEVTQYLATVLPVTRKEEEKWFEGLSNFDESKKVVFSIELIEEKRLIGSCALNSIDLRNQTAEAGIMIGDKECWSKGYGTEVFKLLLDYGFNQLNLNRVGSAALSFNEKSIGLHEKLGFKKEGVKRKVWFRNGKFNDEIVFGLLREEYNKSC